MAKREGRLKAREFLFYTEDLALAGLPGDFPRPERRVMWTILQLSFGDPDIHFELQPQVARGNVELGLHFESDADTNEAWASIVADQVVPILEALGDEWELEEWTPSWRRLHRVFPFTRLTASLGREVAEQLTAALVTLQPVLAGAQARGEAPVPVPRTPEPAPSRRRRHGRGARRGAR